MVRLVLRRRAAPSPTSQRHQGLSYLLVPMEQPGVEVRPIVQITGDSEFNEVFFDGARTDADNVVGAPGDGWKVAMGTLAFERGASTLGQQMLLPERARRDLSRIAQANGAANDPVIRQRLARRVDRAADHALQRAAHALATPSAPSSAREAMITKLYWANVAPRSRQARDGRARRPEPRSPTGVAVRPDAACSASSCSRAPTRSTPARTRSSATSSPSARSACPRGGADRMRPHAAPPVSAGPRPARRQDRARHRRRRHRHRLRDRAPLRSRRAPTSS